MENELTSWIPFNTPTNIHTFDECIELIETLEESKNQDLWVKWKDSANQIVVGTENYYYKIYQVGISAGSFASEIREELGKIYREEFGLLWNIKTIVKDNSIYQVEQREKLKVCSPDDMSFTDLFINWSKTLEKLEDRLILDKITAQINMPGLHKLKLVRDCVNKFEDYAITKDGRIVLLDDADWFLATVDKDDNWFSTQCKVYDIITLTGEKVFGPIDLFNKDNVRLANEKINKWNIFVTTLKADEAELEFRSIREQMLYDNIKVLSTGKALPNNQELYLPQKNQPLISCLSHNTQASEST